jgi:hypothetical protein
MKNEKKRHREGLEIGRISSPCRYLLSPAALPSVHCPIPRYPGLETPTCHVLNPIPSHSRCGGGGSSPIALTVNEC